MSLSATSFYIYDFNFRMEMPEREFVFTNLIISLYIYRTSKPRIDLFKCRFSGKVFMNISFKIYYKITTGRPVRIYT